MILILVGESASGKSTLAGLVEKNTNFSRIVTYTTRPPRNGEKDGVDYHFINYAKFEKMIAENKFIETAAYREWMYGTAINFDENDNKIIVLTPAGARAFRKYAQNHKELGLQLFVVYLEVDRRSRLIKLLERGDDIEEAYRRSLSDVGQFDSFWREADYVLQNPSYYLSPYELYKLLEYQIDNRSKNETI